MSSDLIQTRLALALGACLIAAPAALAQDQAEQLAKPTAVADRVGPGLLEGTVSLPSGVEFTAGQDSTAVSIKGTIRSGVTFAQYLTFTAKAPLEKEGASVLGSLSGLGDATSIEVKLSGSKLGGDLPNYANGVFSPSALQEAQEICHVVLREFKRLNKGDVPPVADLDCPSGRIKSTLLNTYAPEKYDAYDALFFTQDAYVLLWGGTGSVGNQKFEYRDPVTFAEADTSKTPWSIGAYLAYEKVTWNALFVLRADHIRSYEEAKGETRCPTLGTSCVEAVFGPPTLTKRDVISFEARKRFGKFGVSLTTRYDVGDDTMAVDLPVYFIRDDAGGFTGGVRASWDSETDDVVVGIFVSKAFSLFGDL